MASERTGKTAPDAALAADIRGTIESGNAVRTALKTDGRVLARVTDGIYRLPGAALRELISNAYDADATRVTISTDRPRFNRIVVEDDGRGMTPEALAHMLHHIGGSAKRIAEGRDLGITGDDPNISPGGRRLIGKIGIGLFSVAQLTRTFQIITKVAEDPYRTVAQIILKQYSDDGQADADGQLESGLVSIWREPAPQDVETHGTTIILNKIRPRTRDALRDSALWARVREGDATPPRYHVGFFDTETHQLAKQPAGYDSLPFGERDDPRRAFEILVDSVWAEVEESRSNPKLENLFDYYLQMIWQLGLSVPLPYVRGGPLEANTHMRRFELIGEAQMTTEELSREDVLGVASRLGFSAPQENFRVVVDEIELSRPIRFDHLPMSSNAIQTPLLFVGGLRDSFPDQDPALSGGTLAFHAYLLWTPKIAPVDHVGSLVRVHGASGTGFDTTFMKYQAAELTRLKQMTCEIFVTEGLESALNIDRESLNEFHPHTVRLTTWLHEALARTINYQKSLGNRLRSDARSRAEDAEDAALQEIVESTWTKVNNDATSIPRVALASASGGRGSITADLVFNRDRVMGNRANSTSRESRSLERKLIAVQQVLEAWGILDDLTMEDREELLTQISSCLRASWSE